MRLLGKTMPHLRIEVMYSEANARAILRENTNAELDYLAVWDPMKGRVK
jgi:hypothetical protein